MAPEERRPDPDALLAAAAREGRGRLKVFLGAAPGVGKTWEMLAAARRRRDEGADVLAGVIETHGRAETAVQIGDLPILPRRQIPYRGQVLEEFDLDAALARRPGLLLVDELAHTNAPGSRHHKRWQDVAELLEAGIDYQPEMARRALGGFFREGNLAALREIALRRAAQHVDQDLRDYMQSHAIAGPWPAGECVLALVGSDPTGEAVVRHAKRLADALHGRLVVLHVERGDDSSGARRAMALAAELGAVIETRAGADLIAVALDVARTHNATQIVLGRAAPPLWRRLVGRTLAFRLLRQAPAFALHVVPSDGAAPPRPARRLLPIGWMPWVAATALVAGVILIGELIGGVLQHEALGMLFLATVVGVATLYGFALAIYTATLAFLSWNFFFIPPLYRLTIYQPRDVIAIFVFAGVAAATGWLAGRVRQEARVAQGRIEGLRRIGAFSRKLGEPATEAELLEEIARQAAGIAGRAMILTERDGDLNIRAATPAADTMDEGSWAAARWAFTRQEQAGRFTPTLPSAIWRFLPMQTARGMLGLLGVRTEAEFDPPMMQALTALADQAAVALERVRLATEAARSAAQAETQKLRTALLSSLSHDLRTPLTGIRGAAEALHLAWDTLAPETRRDLLSSIEEDTGRMTRFLANILDLTRLESGEVVPRIAAVPVEETIEMTIGRVPGAQHAAVNVPPDLPHVLADPALLEQALVNVLDNAVKYTPVGGHIAVRAREMDGMVTIAVADEGVGIAEEDLPYIFDSFYRARRGDRVAPGTGLGLAIARGLLEAMGGSIRAESPRPDVPADGAPGSVLTLSLPAASG